MNKCFIALTLAGCLMISLSSSVFAAGNSVYFDGLIGGKNTYKFGNSEGNNSLNCYIIGGEYQFDKKIKVAGEIAFGEEGNTSDFNALLIKGDYKIYSKKKLRLDAAAGYYNRSYDESNTIVKTAVKLNGVLIGCDATYTIDKKSSVKGNIGFLVGGKYSYKLAGITYDADATSLIVNLKYTYLVKSNIGITGGYRYLGTSFDDSDGDVQHIHSGLSVGAVYKF